MDDRENVKAGLLSDGEQGGHLLLEESEAVGTGLNAGPYYTYAEYLKLKLEGYYELIRGCLVKMPAPLDPHQAVLGELSYQAQTHVRTGACVHRESPYDVVLFPEGFDGPKETAGGANTVVQPDLCVICDRSKIRRRGCFGAPDFVVEVTSDATEVKDRTTKVLLYEEAGVSEYWIVDPKRRLFELRVLADGRYPTHPTILKAGAHAKSEALRGFSVSVDEVFAAILPGTEA